MKKLCLFGIAVMASLMCVYTAKGLYADDVFLKALQKELHRRGNPWIAGETELSNLPLEEKRKLCGRMPISIDKREMRESPAARMRRLRKEMPPSSWDWRSVNGKNWMTSVKTQGGCGACWSFGMLGMMESRIKIFNNTPDESPNLSEQFIVSCNSFGYGCWGGCDAAFVDVRRDGVPDEACFPYTSGSTGNSGDCNNRCGDWESRVVKVTDWRFFAADDPIVKNEIMEGPISVGVDMKEDFFYYKGGIYEPIMGKNLGSHGVVCCGWNSSGGWLCKNSWGSIQPWFYTFNIEQPTWCMPEVLNAPFIAVGQRRVLNDDNGNGRLDPGESGDIIITLENTGAMDASGTSVTLSVEGTNITVTDGSANYGNIPSHSTGNNTSDPFKVTCSASAPEGSVLATLSIQSNSGAYSWKRYCEIWIGEMRLDYADVKTNNASLTVTDVASIGFIDKPWGKGNGFIYPADEDNTLYHATMAFGNSSSYLVDNWYIRSGTDHDWNTTPDGKLQWVSPPTKGDTMIVGYYDDSGISGAKNVTCRQEAWAFNSPNYDDFVIISFCYTNKGSSTLTDLYSAIFADFEVADAPRNNADINEPKYLAWVSDGYISLYAGITLLDPLDKFANASTIKYTTFMQANDGMTDENQYKFMKRIHHYSSQTTSDYSAMVSAGPFDIAPGDSQVVAFAIVGGKSKTEIEEHSDAARNVYVHGGLEDKDTKVTQGDVTLNVTPSLMLNTGTITFSLPKASKVTIDIYDITGRLVRSFPINDSRFPINEITWDARKVPAGVFFVRLKACDCSGRPICLPLVKKVILLK